MSALEDRPAQHASIDLPQIATIIRTHKIFVFAVTFCFVCISLLYVFLATPTYKVDVLLKPTDAKTSLSGMSAQLGSLGGLANLAGINMNANTSAEPLAVLTSREFTGAFIEDEHLLPVLYSGRWDQVRNDWKPSRFFDPPDIRDAIVRFNKSIRSIQEDKKTGFVTMSIEWKNPLTAANWANTLVERLNERMRSRALTEAELNVGYLKEELASANAVSLQQSISHVLESELQKLMLAKATKEYSFKILDHAVPSKRPAWPRPFLIISIAAFVGVTTSCLFLLLQYSLRSSGTT